jgi:hypothetical protein
LAMVERLGDLPDELFREGDCHIGRHVGMGFGNVLIDPLWQFRPFVLPSKALSPG